MTELKRFAKLLEDAAQTDVALAGAFSDREASERMAERAHTLRVVAALATLATQAPAPVATPEAELPTPAGWRRTGERRKPRKGDFYICETLSRGATLQAETSHDKPDDRPCDIIELSHVAPPAPTPDEADAFAESVVIFPSAEPILARIGQTRGDGGYFNSGLDIAGEVRDARRGIAAALRERDKVRDEKIARLAVSQDRFDLLTRMSDTPTRFQIEGIWKHIDNEEGTGAK